MPFRRHFMAAAVIAATLGSTALQAQELRLARIFTEGMVLQQGMKTPIWGWARPSEKVTVRFADETAAATADANGKWTAYLPALKANSTPDVLSVAGETKRLSLADIVVGEVWVAAGQSNMERIFQIDVGSGYPSQKKSVQTADYPLIRYYKPDFYAAEQPLDDFDRYRSHGTVWLPINSKTIARSSSLPFYFAERLHQKLKVPIGLVQIAVSGTPGFAWTDRKLLEQRFSDALKRGLSRSDDAFIESGFTGYDDFLAKDRQWRLDCAAAIDRGEKRLPTWPGEKPRMTVTNRPSVLYNAQVHPVAPLAIRGVIWHQGEGGPYEDYDKLIACLIEQWRQLHGPEVCFLWGTLANFPAKGKPTAPGLPADGAGRLRQPIQGQIAANYQVANAAGLIFQDLGNGDVHWAAKDTAGYRMSLAARALCYGEKDLVYNGPLFEKAIVEGNRVRVSFKFAGAGLKFKDGDDGSNVFSVAGEDDQFYFANARIDGKVLILWSDQVAKPVSIVYAMDANPDLILFNNDGLPAASFYVRDGKLLLPVDNRKRK